jgi:hypothetical protein
MMFLNAIRFMAGLVGTMLLGGALANLMQGSPLHSIRFLALVGCVGVAIYDPRGRWQAFVAVLVGSFGMFGLVNVTRAFKKEGGQFSWADVSLWRVALYAACLATFFIWNTHRKRMLANLPEDG